MNQFYHFLARLVNNNFVWYGGGFSLLYYSSKYFLQQDFERIHQAKITRAKRESGEADSGDRWAELRRVQDEETRRSE